MAVGDDAVEHMLGGAGWRGKTDAHIATGTRIDRGIDADQVAVDVDQGTARIARIDRGIGLDEVFEGVDAQLAAAQRTDDATGHGLADAKRIADRQYRIAYLQAFRIAQRDCRQLLDLGLQHGQVGIGIGADDACHGAAAIVQQDLDRGGTLDHVVVGQDIAGRADDHATANAGKQVFLAVAIARCRQAGGGLALIRVGQDADDGGRGLLCCRAQGFGLRARDRLVACRCLDHGDTLVIPRPRHPVWAHGRHHQEQGQRNRHNLRE